METEGKRIRVLQFSISEARGGRTQYLLSLWNQIDKIKFQFDFITFSENISFEEEIKKTGANIYYIKNYPEKNKEKFVEEFMNVLKNGYDAIHIATGFWKDTIIEDLAKKAGVPRIIIHSHSSGINAKNIHDEDAEKIHNKIKNELNPDMADYFVACSNKAADWLYGERIPKNKQKTIYSGINVARFRYDEEKRKIIRSQLGLGDAFVFGFIGRLEMVKNIEFIMEIFSHIYEANKKVQLIIVGEGSQKADLESKAKTLDSRDAIRFLGHIDNPEDYLQAMDVYLLPSFFEGFPIGLLEAQCTGIKCITSTNVTEEAVATENVDRLPLEEKDRWIDRIEELIEGYQRKDESQNLTGRGFDMRSHVKEIENLYVVDK